MKYSIMLRIWHWLNALAVFVLVATALLRKTFLSVDETAGIIIQSAKEYHFTISNEIAKTAAKAIYEPMWEWHILFGYFLVFLLVFRVFIFVKEGVSYVETDTLYKKLTTITYTIFYSLTFFMVLSGLVLSQNAHLEASNLLLHDIKNLHNTTAWFFIFFLPLHIMHVIINNALNKNRTISKMVTGD
ncbi:MAG: cytochrome b/b6 domain-containing protein [Campylobacterales bacterium]|nr:cytochrome b/b6 domain-containing protein [Campylobacterales bacterium]